MELSPFDRQWIVPLGVKKGGLSPPSSILHPGTELQDDPGINVP